MKGRIKRTIALALSAMLAFTMIAAGTFAVSAADDNWKIGLFGFPGEYWEGYDGDLYLYSDKVDYDEDIISAKSSNVSVAKITKGIDVDTYLYHIEFKKAGKTKLTVKFRTPEGEKKTVKQTITVKKYPDPFKSLKINGKKVKISKNKFRYYGKISKNKKTVSIKAELNKGWKIRKIEARRYDRNWKESKLKITKKMLTKGSSISFPKKYESLEATVFLYKGKKQMQYDIAVDRS